MLSPAQLPFFSFAVFLVPFLLQKAGGRGGRGGGTRGFTASEHLLYKVTTFHNYNHKGAYKIETCLHDHKLPGVGGESSFL